MVSNVICVRFFIFGKQLSNYILDNCFAILMRCTVCIVSVTYIAYDLGFELRFYESEASFVYV